MGWYETGDSWLGARTREEGQGGEEREVPVGGFAEWRGEGLEGGGEGLGGVGEWVVVGSCRVVS